MANTIQFKRGLEANRTSVTPAAGEILYTTDDKKVYIGDGSTAGGNIVSASGGAFIEATASGALANGDLVVVNSDGTVSVVAGQTADTGTAATFNAASTADVYGVYSSAADKVVLSYKNSSNNWVAVVGAISGTTISWGTPATFATSAFMYPQNIVYDENADRIAVVYADYNNSSYGTCRIGTISGTSISFGSAVIWLSAYADSYTSSGYDASNNKLVIAYQDYFSSKRGYTVVGTISGTSVSFGTAQMFSSTWTNSIWLSYNSTQQNFLIAYADVGSSSYGTCIAGSVSGTSMTFGTAVVFNSGGTSDICAGYASNVDRHLVLYNTGSVYYKKTIRNLSGSLTAYSASTLSSSPVYDYGITYNPTLSKLVFCYRDSGSTNDGTMKLLTVTSTSSSVYSTTVYSSGYARYNVPIYDTTNSKLVVAWRDDDLADNGYAIVFQDAFTNLTASNFVGISDGAYADTATATIQTAGAVDDAQTGLTAGSTYYVQTDGTLSTTADSPSVVAGTAVSSTSILVKG